MTEACKPAPDYSAWRRAYIARLVVRGVPHAMAVATYEAGVDSHDWEDDPADAADEELSCWAD